MDENTKNQLVESVVQGIANAETGGVPVEGKSGEAKSIFQFLPSTWKSYATDVLGDPNAPITKENELKVMRYKVRSQVDKGMSVRQIASAHNAGEGEPDAYTGKFGKTTKTHRAGDPSKGINSSGVAYDTPAYADKVNKFAMNYFVQQHEGTPKNVVEDNQPAKVAKETNPVKNIVQSILPEGLSLSSLLSPTKAQAQEKASVQDISMRPGTTKGLLNVKS